MRNWILAVAVILLASVAWGAEPATTQPAKELTLDLGNGASLKLVLIPAGKFMMGSPETEEGRDKNEVQHRVTISNPFYMGAYLVTQEQWQAVMGNNPSRFKGAKNPVENVSWDDCQDFVAKVNQKLHGQKASLPTEGQWEYACRAGTTTGYNTGDGEESLKKAGWYQDNSGDKTHPVGEKTPNAWGLYDMHGNVWEWCSDWLGDYPAGEVIDPTGPEDGDFRLLRGGSRLNLPTACRAACRFGGGPGDRTDTHGFRLAVSVGRN